MNIIWSADQSIVGLTEAGDFSVGLTQIAVSSGGTAFTGTDKDYAYSRVLAVNTSNGYSVEVSPSQFAAATLTTDNDTVAQIVERTILPQSGQNGQVGLLVAASAGTRRYPVTVSYSSSAFGSNDVTSYTAGSLAADVDSIIYGYASGKTAGLTTQKLFSAANYSTAAPSATLNASLFCSGMDFSATSFCREYRDVPGGAVYDTFLFPMELISDKHALYSRHTPTEVGFKVVFRKTDGTFVTKTVAAITTSSEAEDYAVCMFDSAVSGITPIKTLGSGWEAKLPCLYGYPAGYLPPSLPMFFKGARWSDGSYENHMRVCSVAPYASSDIEGNSNNGQFLGDYLQGRYASWRFNVESGDSSGCTFFMAGSQRVLWGLQHVRSGGPFIPSKRTAIDAIMTAQAGSAYAMAVADLSSYTTP